MSSSRGPSASRRDRGSRPTEVEFRDAAIEEVRRVTELDVEAAGLLFQTVEQRRQTLDQMMWQVPALGLTAQAFLLTIALGAGSSWLARSLAAGLGVTAALAGIQLMLKHRYHEELFSNWLEAFGRTRAWPLPNSPLQAEGFAYDGEHDWERIGSGWPNRWLRMARLRIIRFRSPYVWVLALLLFFAADVGVLTLCFTHLLFGFEPLG